LFTADLIAAAISVCDLPDSTSLVFIKKKGRELLAAAALKQWGARTLGFQNCASSVVLAHERSTMQTNPLDPFAALV